MKRILIGTLAIVLFAGAAQAQVKGDSAMHHHRKAGHEMMAKELNLTADQQARMKAINEAQKTEMKALMEKNKTNREQMKAQHMELMKKYQDQRQAVLTSAQKAQLEKMKEERKTMAKEKGHKHFKKEGMPGKKGQQGLEKRKEMAQELNLSQDQKNKMAQIRENGRKQFESIRDDKSLSQDQKKEKMKALKEKQKEEMKSILTKEQIEKMKAGKKDRTPKTK